jgi:hypothetical protein
VIVFGGTPMQNIEAVAPAELEVTRRRPEPMTSRRVWVTTLVITALLLGARSGAIYGYVQSEIQRNGIAAEVNDKNLEQLAVNIGFTLALLISLAVLLVFYSIAALMERNIFGVSMPIMRGVRVGPFYPIVLGSTVPVHLGALVLGLTAPKDQPLYYVYVLTISVLCPLLFRRYWKTLPTSKKVAYFGCCLGLAVLSMAT